MLWIKALHIAFVVCWFAGIFYLPRLFVNLAMVEDDATYRQLLVMARKLYRFMTPLAVLALVFGLWLLVLVPDYLRMGWMHAKLALVLLLVGYHHGCGRLLVRFEKGENRRSHRFYRLFNELPVLLLFVVVILVVVRPF